MAKQNRGTDPVSVKAVLSYLSINPSSTIDEICRGTTLTRPTVDAVVKRLCEPSVGRPRTWNLKSTLKAEIKPAQAVPLKQTWARWIKATQAWPVAITKMGQATEPALIAQGLESLAANASALAVSFRAVQNEPDWLKRIGAE